MRDWRADGHRLVHGVSLYEYAELPSTNSTALDMVAAGVADATALMAVRQIAGRGRQGKVWHAPAGNLNLSLIWQDQPVLGGFWSLLAGIIVTRAVEALYPSVVCRLKWPNDIMIGAAKVGGILIERRDISGPMVIGMGINIVAAPPITDRPVTAIVDHVATDSLGPQVPSAYDLAVVILDNFMFWRHNTQDDASLRQDIVSQWQDRAWGIGCQASWSAGREQVRITGTARGLDPDGAFVIVDKVGHHHRIMAGEVGFDVVNH